LLPNFPGEEEGNMMNKEEFDKMKQQELGKNEEVFREDLLPWIKEIEIVKEHGFDTTQAIEIVKMMHLEWCLRFDDQPISDTLNEIRMLIDNCTGTFKDRTFLNVVASIYEN